MAVYKVPQNVEADDKLIGPFSFRQFIYLIIVVMCGGLAWALSQVFIGLAIIPLPIMIFFGALALPLRKDQPMEVYLAAIVSFHLKPRKRLWDPDGIDSMIEITVPRIVEQRLTKDLTQEDAEQRIRYLASLVDSGGWAIRGVTGPQDSPMNTDAFYEAQTAQDVLDTSNTVGQSFNTLMEQRTERIKEEAMERMHMPIPQPAVPSQSNPFLQQQFQPQPQTQPTPVYDPYPTDIQQTVIQPVGDTAHQYQSRLRQTPEPTPPPAPPVPPLYQMPPELPPTPVQPAAQTAPATTSSNPISPDIMSLANNTDLSIETIAHEAKRIHDKENEAPDEVVIKLR